MKRAKFRFPATIIASVLGVAVLMALAAALAAGDGGGAPTKTRMQAAERLVIRYSATGFELVSRTPLMKVLPPTVSLPGEKGAVSGSWFEVQSDGGDVVYRRRISSPRMVYTEAPTEDEPGVLKREEIAVDENVFSILVPAGTDAKSLIFYDSNPDIQKRTEAAIEIGRIGLR